MPRQLNPLPRRESRVNPLGQALRLDFQLGDRRREVHPIGVLQLSKLGNPLLQFEDRAFKVEDDVDGSSASWGTYLNCSNRA
ncbi:MAG: hypothetical protein ACJAZO_001848 [Myxococcota bacterium]|jgi:hypothetical protein